MVIPGDRWSGVDWIDEPGRDVPWDDSGHETWHDDDGPAERPSLQIGRLVVAIVIPALTVVALHLSTARPPTSADDTAAEAATADAASADAASPESTSSESTSSASTAETGQALVAPPVARSSFSVAVTGEILPHPSVVEHAARFGTASGQAYDFAPIFADLRSVVEAADLAICHLEVPVAPLGTPLSGYPTFAIPSDVGWGIGATGWDRCSTASNHSNDIGTAGIVATLDALDAAQVAHSGMARTREEAATPRIAQAGEVRIGHLSATAGFNGAAPAESWMADLLDVDRIVADARRARIAGADLVVVSLHWGVEYDHAGSAHQRRIANELLASPDIDLIIGHGPHVLQPIETFHGKYALLSVGNIVANQGTSRPATYDGVVVTITFEEGADGRYRAVAPVVEPTWYDAGAGRVRLVRPALGDPVLAPQHPDLAASLERTQTILGPFLATG